MKNKESNRAGSKNMMAAELQDMGLIEKSGVHEVTDDGVYKLWTTPGRINRKKVACFIDLEIGFMVQLPKDCPEYRPECNREQCGITAIHAG
ncbi:MAG: hypothetical protein KKC20_22930 [Proteobacteria bacterium]|nr:hypothetical protein [Pseudomonadota bacterium]